MKEKVKIIIIKKVGKAITHLYRMVWNEKAIDDNYV